MQVFLHSLCTSGGFVLFFLFFWVRGAFRSPFCFPAWCDASASSWSWYKLCDSSHTKLSGALEMLSDVGLNTKDKWRNLWTDNNIANKELVSDPTEEPPDLNLPWKQWSTLHRISTIHARHHTTFTNGFQIQPIMRLWLPRSGYSSHCDWVSLTDIWWRI